MDGKRLNNLRNKVQRNVIMTIFATNKYNINMFKNFFVILGMLLGGVAAADAQVQDLSVSESQNSGCLSKTRGNIPTADNRISNEEPP